MNPNPPPSWLPAAIAGLCATLIGLGLGRFAYVPLFPLMIDAGWTSASGASQLAAANLIGHLVGAVAAHRLALHVGASTAVRGSMIALLLSMLCCSVNLGFGWLWLWRLVAGASGCVLLIVAPPTILARVPAAVRGKTIGLVFCGIGSGIILSGFTVPAFGAAHLEAAWLALAALVAVASIIAWPAFRTPGIVAPLPAAVQPRLIPAGALLTLLCAYVLDAVGSLPHTVFWVEYLVHGLHQPLSAGGTSWVIFGAGAAVGPLLTGYAADRIGFHRTLIAGFALKAASVALPLLSTSMTALSASSFVVGALTPGLGAAVSGRVIEIAGGAAHQRSWAMLTFAFAVLQAAGGYAMAVLYGATASFTLIFAIGAVALAVAAAIIAFGSKEPLCDPVSSAARR
jgi:predicted MFS family arabinose efflux permease